MGRDAYRALPGDFDKFIPSPQAPFRASRRFGRSHGCSSCGLERETRELIFRTSEGGSDKTHTYQVVVITAGVSQKCKILCLSHRVVLEVKCRNLHVVNTLIIITIAIVAVVILTAVIVVAIVTDFHFTGWGCASYISVKRWRG